MEGRVLFFNHTYGFIKSEECKIDIFFHYKDISCRDDFKELFKGDLVSFDVEESENTIKAHNVTKVTEEVDGKPVIRVRIFNMKSSQFNLDDFYLNVISKMTWGLKYATIVDDDMVLSSEHISKDEALEIIKNKTINSYEIKFI